MFKIKKREGVGTFVHAVSLYVAGTPKAVSLHQRPGTAVTQNTFWHCRVRFCWTTFLETVCAIT